MGWRQRPAVLAFVLYGAVAFGYFGVSLFFHGDGQTFLGIGGDPEIFIWSFGWWPHAILHGQNPFITHAIWAPDGTNLAWTTSVPGLALAFSPLTLLAGPALAFNVAAALMPALCAWTAFLLCHHITRKFWPSILGGYLFGFSIYMLGALQGHLHLTSVFLVPLVALVLLRYLEGSLDRRGLALRLGVLLGLQLTLSTEVAFTLAIVLVVALVLAFALLPEQRPRLRSLLPALALACVVCAVVASPLLYFAFTDLPEGAVNPGSPPGADLVGFFVPTDLVAVGKGWTTAITERFTGNRSERGWYIGIPEFVIFVLAAVSWRRRAWARFLLALIAAIAFLSFGTWFRVYGHQVVPLPWEHIGYLPIFENVYPARFAMYIALALGAVVALWTADESVARRLRIGLGVLAVVALVPNLTAHAWKTTIPEPAFITQKGYERCLTHDDNVLVFPFGSHGDAMLWQVDAGFRFPMAEGYIAPSPPSSFRHPPGVALLAIWAELPNDNVAPLREYVRVKHVTVALVDIRRAGPWPRRLRKLARPQEAGGVLIYRFAGRTPTECV